MLLPFRSKNPPVVFPWVTVALIVVNVLIFALTSESFLQIRETVLGNYGMIHSKFSMERLFAYMFLHANTIHLIGNMLFLWIFGGAVEGRIGWYLFLPFYLTCGLASGVAHDLLSGVLAPNIPMIGASGAIMGVLGAYLWLSPYSHVLVLIVWSGFSIIPRGRVTTWQAMWLILLYAVGDIFEGFLFRNSGGGGTANFAHLGGMLSGFLILLASGMARESEDFSEAQAAKSDSGGNFMTMTAFELEGLITGPQPQVEAVFAYSRKILQFENGYKKALEAMTRHADLILAQGNSEQFAILAADIPPSVGRLPGRFLLGLAQKLEIEGSYELAARVYRQITRDDERGPDAEIALLRYARLMEQMNADKNYAASVYQEMLRLFPLGPQAATARTSLERIGKTAMTYSAATGQHTQSGPAGAPGLAGVGKMGAPSPAPAPTGGMAPVGLTGVAPMGGLAGVGGPAPVPTSTGKAEAPAPASPGLASISGLSGVGGPAPAPAAPSEQPGGVPGLSPLPPGLASVSGFQARPATETPQETPEQPSTPPQIFLAPVGSHKPPPEPPQS